MAATATDRELWLLNFYRNSELHGALLMGRLARTLGDRDLLLHVTEHCATEARHASILTETIAAVDGRLDPREPTIQEHYSAKGGVPTALADLLVLSEILEKRVLISYREHVERDDVHPEVERSLRRILREMVEEEEGEHAGWIDRALTRLPADTVEAAEAKWRAIDEQVAAELHATLRSRFPEASA